VKKSFSEDTLINIGFYGGLVIKAVNALLEIMGGIMISILSNEWLDRFIWSFALPELTKDPDDPLMNYLITLSQNFSSSSQHWIAIYMILHGVTKLAIILLLWKQKLWAFPLAVAVFGVFISYEIYSYLHSHSLLMLLIVIFDVAIIIVIILEYIRLRAKRRGNGLN